MMRNNSSDVICMAQEIVYLTISHLSYTDERNSKNITDRVSEQLGPIILRKEKKRFIDRYNFMEQVRKLFFTKQLNSNSSLH